MTEGADAEHIDQLAQDDWTDQDLLTKAEARARLVEEVERTRVRLGQLRTGTGNPVQDSAETKLLERRLSAMESVRNEYDAYLGGS